MSNKDLSREPVHFRSEGGSYCGTKGPVFGYRPKSLEQWEMARTNSLFQNANYYRCHTCMAKALITVKGEGS